MSKHEGWKQVKLEIIEINIDESDKQMQLLNCLLN